MIKEIRKYSGFFENSIKQRFAYKFKAMAFSASSIIFMLIQYYLWRAIFLSNGGTLFSVSINQYLAYIGIGLLIENLTYCPQDLMVGDEIKTGNVAMNLLKPFSYRMMAFSRHVGEKVGDLVSLVPVFITVVVVTGVTFAPPLIILQFLISLCLGVVIAFLICYLTGILAFWATNIWGLHFLRKSLTFLFSGHVVAISIFLQLAKSNTVFAPLPFITPEFLRGFFGVLGYTAYLLPFQATYFTPTGIYTGLISGQGQILIHILVQIFWVVFLLRLTSFVWKKAEQRISILGG